MASRANRADIESTRKSNKGKTAWVKHPYGHFYEWIPEDEFDGRYNYPVYPTTPEMLSALTLDLIGKFRRTGVFGHGCELPPKRPRFASCPIIPRKKAFKAVAGQKLRECGAAMDALSGGDKATVRCLTLTLPANHADAYKALAAYSGYVMDRIGALIRRQKVAIAYFYVWELQSRGALHLHMALHATTRNLAAKMGAKVVQQWLKSLQAIEDKSGVDMHWSGQVDCEGNRIYTHRRHYQNRNEPVRSSCAGYFAKYAGKGNVTKVNDGKHFGYDNVLHPHRLWGSNKPIKDKIKEMTLNLEVEYPTDTLASVAFDDIKALFQEYQAKFSTAFHFDIDAILRDGTSIKVAEGVTEVYYSSPESFSDLSALCHLKFQKERMEVLLGSYRSIAVTEQDASQRIRERVWA